MTRARIFVAIGLLLVAGGPTASAQVTFAPTVGVSVDRAEVDGGLTAALASVVAARDACLSEPSCARTAAALSLDAAAVRLADLRAGLGFGAFAAAGPACPYPLRPGVTPATLPAPAFDALDAAVSATGSDDGKLARLSAAARGAWFTVGQVQALLRTFAFSAMRLRALEALAPKVADSENGLLLEQTFATEGDQLRARKILAEGAACPGLAVEQRDRARQGRPLAPVPESFGFPVR